MGGASSRSLGAALRKLRTEHKPPLTMEEVANQFGWHKSKVSRIERGISTIPPRDVRALVAFYGVEDVELIDAMVKLAAASRHRNWWHRYTDVLPRQFATYLGLEGEAASMHSWEPVLVPGLLQTESYARALIAIHRTGQNDAETDRRVEARMERQALLRGPGAPNFHAIIGENALHQMIGGRQVMGEQLRHLAETAERSNVTVQVVPWSAGACMPMEGGFQILRFADSAAGQVICIDLRMTTIYLDDPAEIDGYRDAWEDVLAKALPPNDSLRIIKAATTEGGKT
ncbi:helix-turn-helix domain-containing protein [Actinoplanes sp. HUAS TT8]|uniref:helix-turn-helix domain-containing protein n=1 Tax=Actinoplanes sp. HUAS TT8 TaxID=3447453 RepID=UPI003F528E2E